MPLKAPIITLSIVATTLKSRSSRDTSIVDIEKSIQIVTDLITAVVQLLRRDINGLVKIALGELELVKL